MTEQQPHAYAIEVLVNAGTGSEHWKFYDDFEFSRSDEEEEARDFRDLLIEDGYSPEHLRVVAISTLPRSFADALREA